MRAVRSLSTTPVPAPQNCQLVSWHRHRGIAFTQGGERMSGKESKFKDSDFHSPLQKLIELHDKAFRNYPKFYVSLVTVTLWIKATCVQKYGAGHLLRALVRIVFVFCIPIYRSLQSYFYIALLLVNAFFVKASIFLPLFESKMREGLAECRRRW